MWVQQQDVPEWGNLPSKLQTPVHLHGRCCWMRLPLSPCGHCAQNGLRKAKADEGTWRMLWPACLSWGESCGEETHEEAQKRQQDVWKRPHRGERVESGVDRRIQVSTWWEVWFWLWQLEQQTWHVCYNSWGVMAAFLFKPSEVFTSDPLAHMLVAGVYCVPQTTAWSPCSKSCGTGVSTRMTNSNSQCKLTKETRICQIRSCSQRDRRKVHFKVLFYHLRCNLYTTFYMKVCSCIECSLKDDFWWSHVNIWFWCLISNRLVRNVTTQKRPGVLLNCPMQAAVAWESSSQSTVGPVQMGNAAGLTGLRRRLCAFGAKVARSSAGWWWWSSLADVTKTAPETKKRPLPTTDF